MNPLTLVHIAILGLSLWSLVLAGRASQDRVHARSHEERHRTHPLQIERHWQPYLRSDAVGMTQLGYPMDGA